MISYNQNDYNISKISAMNTNYNGLKTKYSYHVYGLTQTGNIPVEVDININSSRALARKCTAFIKWLTLNGIKSQEDIGTSKVIKLGLRRDIRAKPKFAAALIRTFVAFFEGALKLKPSFKLPKIKLKRNRTGYDGYGYNAPMRGNS